MNNQSIIGEIVAENYKAASVFKKHGIDFCCNGKRTIENACKETQIDEAVLLQELDEALKHRNGGDIDFKAFPLDLLADYIEKTHHRYVTSKITEIVPYLRRIVEVHGKHHPELYEMETLFLASAEELMNHLKKEENMLFPQIRKIAVAKLTNSGLPQSPFGSIANPIGVMHLEHNAEGERFRKIEALSNGYTPPEGACNTYRVTLNLLQEFENDLHQHIHLENNILFPKAMELERTFPD